MPSLRRLAVPRLRRLKGYGGGRDPTTLRLRRAGKGQAIGYEEGKLAEEEKKAGKEEEKSPEAAAEESAKSEDTPVKAPEAAVEESAKPEDASVKAPEAAVEESAKPEDAPVKAPEAAVEESAKPEDAPVGTVKKVAPKKGKDGEQDVYRGTGRRKASVARIFLKKGDGRIRVNKRELDEYFPREIWRREVLEPLLLTEKKGSVDFDVNVYGGGTTGQAGAVRHALSRALVLFDESTRKILRKAGCLTRDSRMVERKKPGQPGARKRYQYSKR